MMARTYPRIGSLAGRVLARLLAGDAITHRDVDQDARTYRLAAHAHNLRQLEWRIVSEWECGPTRDPVGRVANWTRYRLPVEQIADAGEEGRCYAESSKAWEAMRMAEGTGKQAAITVRLPRNEVDPRAIKADRIDPTIIKGGPR